MLIFSSGTPMKTFNYDAEYSICFECLSSHERIVVAELFDNLASD